MEILLTDRLYDRVSCIKLIRDPNHGFIGNLSPNTALNFNFLKLDCPKEGLEMKTKSLILKHRQDICDAAIGDVPFRMIDWCTLENSDPGYLYVVESIDNLRAMPNDEAIMLSMVYKDHQTITDVEIFPKQLGYALECPDEITKTLIRFYSNSLAAYLVSIPHMSIPGIIIPANYGYTTFMEWRTYKLPIPIDYDKLE